MKTFEKVACLQGTNKWKDACRRQKPIYQREGEIRSDFWRDYNRLLHCKAYRRLKHKTQVFHATDNDHVCTRIEHVNHVCSVSYSIANYLGLNTELALAIGIGHDIGHAPFGHDGEKILNQLAQTYYQGVFWHERNGLFFADKIEMLENEQGEEENLNLTYAVRDGIISHCGEVDETNIHPREKAINLENIQQANTERPFTWEACVVKIADKISYLGRDLEDAIRLKIIQEEQMRELRDIEHQYWGEHLKSSSNTAMIHSFSVDLCQNSTPKDGIRFSKKCFETINKIKSFNYKYIYQHPRLDFYEKYAHLILTSIFKALEGLYDERCLDKNMEEAKLIFPQLINHFQKWLYTYSDLRADNPNQVFLIKEDKAAFYVAVVSFISSMSDSFAVKMFEELTTF